MRHKNVTDSKFHCKTSRKHHAFLSNILDIKSNENY